MVVDLILNLMALTIDNEYTFGGELASVAWTTLREIQEFEDSSPGFHFVSSRLLGG
ncbi:hypothetical protein THII_1671 [Thioploca ingrica]|uniref:Uncharacterized protein n=1 Tax=Thioploca ingrica TaxID=40754 RepID=A0A090ADK9_9GAMM|nr:hypothetical protein THII_1671 [Thioploca ingrica]